ncbi:MAG TPA: carboxypeptidase regulatory-like domain-containing protein [Candidatus Polarisedimenticolaceae bacterium]
MSLRRIAAAAVVALGAVVSAFAQSGTGGLKVVVIDGSDKTPMPGVVVTISSPSQLVPNTAIQTDATGTALFPVLRAGGDYVLDIFMPGYSRQKMPKVRVEIGRTSTVAIALSPEMVETITVEGTKGSVDIDKEGTSTKYSDQFIQDLPVAGRLYQNVLTLAPGVQDADGDGNPNVLGARDRDFKATVNGVSNQDPLTGQWLNLVNQDSIEEVEIIQTGAGAEYGRAQGGFAQIIQKQGSNDFEGTFNFIYQSKALNGNGATDIPSDQLSDFRTLQPAVSISGPVVRDKLWYRFAYELLDREDPVPIGGTAVNVNTTRQNMDGQLTWQVSPRNKLAFQVRADPLEQTNGGVSQVTPVDSSYSLELGGPTYQVQWTAPYSPKLFVDSLIAYQDTTQKISPTTSGVANDCITADGNVTLEFANCFNVDTSTSSGSYPLTWDDSRQRMTVKSDGTYFAGQFWGANHEFKAGMIIENERYFRKLTRRPTGNFFVLEPSFVPDEGSEELDPIGIYAGSFAVPEQSSARAVGTSWSFYASDQIKPLNNLTINVGFRFDREQIDSDGWIPFDPEAEARRYLAGYAIDDNQSATIAANSFTAYEGVNQLAEQIKAYLGENANLGGSAQQSTFAVNTRRQGSINLVNNNFAPRLSVAWDPWSDGKTKFAASYGRYYDKIFLAVPLIELEPVIANVTFDAELLNNEWVVNPSNTPINPALTVSVVDRNLRTPYQDEYALSFERELWTETTFRATIVKRNFEDQLQDINLNKVPGDYGTCVVQSTPDGPYIDTTTPDGIIDDCAGELLGVGSEVVGGGSGFGRDRVLTRPDGIPDLYLQNPYWGDIFFVGNYNQAEYKGLILALERRQYRNWQMDASYTYSEAKGSAEDFQLALGDDRSTLADEYGYLSFDQRHVVKVNATTLTPWGFRLGTSVSWQSGLPYSILTRDFSYTTSPPQYALLGGSDSPVRQFYPTGQRNDQRNRSYWNFDVKASKEMNLPRGLNLQLSVLVKNLLNDGTYIVFTPGINYGRQINGVNDATQRFGRQFELGMRLAF